VTQKCYDGNDGSDDNDDYHGLVTLTIALRAGVDKLSRNDYIKVPTYETTLKAIII